MAQSRKIRPLASKGAEGRVLKSWMRDVKRAPSPEETLALRSYAGAMMDAEQRTGKTGTPRFRVQGDRVQHGNPIPGMKANEWASVAARHSVKPGRPMTKATPAPSPAVNAKGSGAPKMTAIQNILAGKKGSPVLNRQQAIPPSTRTPAPPDNTGKDNIGELGYNVIDNFRNLATGLTGLAETSYMGTLHPYVQGVKGFAEGGPKESARRLNIGRKNQTETIKAFGLGVNDAADKASNQVQRWLARPDEILPDVANWAYRNPVDAAATVVPLVKPGITKIGRTIAPTLEKNATYRAAGEAVTTYRANKAARTIATGNKAKAAAQAERAMKPVTEAAMGATETERTAAGQVMRGVREKAPAKSIAIAEAAADGPARYWAEGQAIKGKTPTQRTARELLQFDRDGIAPERARALAVERVKRMGLAETDAEASRIVTNAEKLLVKRGDIAPPLKPKRGGGKPKPPSTGGEPAKPTPPAPKAPAAPKATTPKTTKTTAPKPKARPVKAQEPPVVQGTPEQATAMAEPPRPDKSIYEMSWDELESLRRDLKAWGDNADIEALGPERAKAYQRAQRTLNSSTVSPYGEGYKKARVLVDEIESSLTPEQERRLFGVRDDSIPDLETVTDLQRKIGTLDDDSPQALGESLKWAITRLNGKTDIAAMTTDERIAFGQIRRATEIANERGWNPADVVEHAIRSGAERFDDIDDALMMVRPVARQVGMDVEAVNGRVRVVRPEQPASASQSALPAPLRKAVDDPALRNAPSETSALRKPAPVQPPAPEPGPVDRGVSTVEPPAGQYTGEIPVYHGTNSDFVDFREGGGFGAQILDPMGPHFGTEKAANQRLVKLAGKKGLPDSSRIIDGTLNVEKPLLNADGQPYTEGELRAFVAKTAKKLGYGTVEKKAITGSALSSNSGRAALAVRKWLIEQGYDAIPYINAVEDKGSVSWISLKPEGIAQKGSRYLKTGEFRPFERPATPPAPETMTRDAYIADDIAGYEGWESQTPEHQATYRGWIAAQHEGAVERAVKAGKPVPPEVLADYPDLAPAPEIPGVTDSPIDALAGSNMPPEVPVPDSGIAGYYDMRRAGTGTGVKGKATMGKRTMANDRKYTGANTEAGAFEADPLAMMSRRTRAEQTFRGYEGARNQMLDVFGEPVPPPERAGNTWVPPKSFDEFKAQLNERYGMDPSARVSLDDAGLLDDADPFAAIPEAVENTVKGTERAVPQTVADALEDAFAPHAQSRTAKWLTSVVGPKPVKWMEALPSKWQQEILGGFPSYGTSQLGANAFGNTITYPQVADSFVGHKGILSALRGNMGKVPETGLQPPRMTSFGGEIGAPGLFGKFDSAPIHPLQDLRDATFRGSNRIDNFYRRLRMLDRAEVKGYDLNALTPAQELDLMEAANTMGGYQTLNPALQAANKVFPFLSPTVKGADTLLTNWYRRPQNYLATRAVGAPGRWTREQRMRQFGMEEDYDERTNYRHAFEFPYETGDKDTPVRWYGKPAGWVDQSDVVRMAQTPGESLRRAFNPAYRMASWAAGRDLATGRNFTDPNVSEYRGQLGTPDGKGGLRRVDAVRPNFLRYVVGGSIPPVNALLTQKERARGTVPYDTDAPWAPGARIDSWTGKPLEAYPSTWPQGAIGLPFGLSFLDPTAWAGLGANVIEPPGLPYNPDEGKILSRGTKRGMLRELRRQGALTY